MKYTVFILFIITSLSWFSCAKEEPFQEEPLPVPALCMELKIEEFELDSMYCEQGAAVAQYLFQEETVYVFSPGLCMSDALSEVASDSCFSIGFLGGPDNNAIINGVNFYENSEFRQNVWEN